MESNVVPAPNYHNAASFFGYPEIAGAALHLKVANAACSGETSSSLINPKAQSNGCENSPGNPSVGYRTQFPLHVKYKGSQLAFALSYLKAHKNVSLVTLMIGANDFFVCQETKSDGCATPAEQNAVAAKVTSNIHTILGSIRKKAHYAGQIAIVNYYSLNYSVPAVNAQSQLLNKTQDAAAKPYHVVIADGYGRAAEGRRALRRKHLPGRTDHRAQQHPRHVWDSPQLCRAVAAGAVAREGDHALTYASAPGL